MAKDKDTKQSVYRNTVIFAVVAALVTVILLVVVVSVPAAANFRLAFLTVDIGLLAIIIYAIVRINRQNTKYDELLQEAGNFKMAVDSCPDYFTTHHENGKTMCSGVYTSPRRDVKYTILDANNDPIPDINLSDIHNRRAREVCSIVNSDDFNGVNHQKVPWTEVRAKCTWIKYSL